MNVKVGISNRHIHLCEKDFKVLFGETDLSVKNYLSQKGEFASLLVLSIKTDKNILKNVRVIGPLREKTQVEISLNDAYLLGINPPIRMSGDLDNSADVILVNNDTQLFCKNSCIIAHRHIHINTLDQEKFNLNSGDSVSVKVNGVRSGVLNNVLVKSGYNYTLELHIDIDEANAFCLNNGDEVEILRGE